MDPEWSVISRVGKKYWAGGELVGSYCEERRRDVVGIVEDCCLVERQASSDLISVLHRPPENTEKGRIPILGVSGLGWWTEIGPKRGFTGGLVPDIPNFWRSKGS